MTDTVFDPIEGPAEGAADPAPPQGRSAYDRLLDEIRTGRLPPGARLREADLAARLGISRTPVREAIRQLEAEGLVVHEARSGASIRRLDHAEVMELYEMRSVLEGTAARMAARSAADVELAELKALNMEMAGAVNDPERTGRLNRQFHATLLNAARNRFLSRAMATLQRTLLILGPTTLADPDRAEQALLEHGRILKALAARDMVEAELAMRSHIEMAQLMRLRQLRDAGAQEEPNAADEI
jgi:DNA-binding GntR family transcriptional regulator